MPLPVHVISSPTLERWDWTTPWTTGIGGSETSHIEMVNLLQRQNSLEVSSYAPLPLSALSFGERGYENRLGWNVSEDWVGDKPGVIINYRDPKLYDHSKFANQKRWFIAQDVDYPGLWNDTNLATVDRYICLCKTHGEYTLQHYPSLKGRIYISSNGVRSSYLDDLTWTPPERIPYRMLYASSPDRGLLLLLQNWFRIRERFPEATLHVAYGFNNMDTIIKLMGGNDPRLQLKAELEQLFDQRGVTWLGRLNQRDLYKEWFSASVWAHPTSWPETNCITCMDAMACGTIPCTNSYWAIGEYVRRGYLVDGVPQNSELIRSHWLNNLYKALSDTTFDRNEMMTWARKQFDWNRVCHQWMGWLDEDRKCLSL